MHSQGDSPSPFRPPRRGGPQHFPQQQQQQQQWYNRISEIAIELISAHRKKTPYEDPSNEVFYQELCQELARSFQIDDITQLGVNLNAVHAINALMWRNQVSRAATDIVERRKQHGQPARYIDVIREICQAYGFEDASKLGVCLPTKRGMLQGPFFVPILRRLRDAEADVGDLAEVYAFQKSFGSVTDFEQAARRHFEKQKQLDLMELLGPLWLLPDVMKAFHLPAALQRAPTAVGRQQLVKHFIEYFYDVKKKHGSDGKCTKDGFVGWLKRKADFGQENFAHLGLVVNESRFPFVAKVILTTQGEEDNKLREEIKRQIFGDLRRATTMVAADPSQYQQYAQRIGREFAEMLHGQPDMAAEQAVARLVESYVCSPATYCALGALLYFAYRQQQEHPASVSSPSIPSHVPPSLPASPMPNPTAPAESSGDPSLQSSTVCNGPESAEQSPVALPGRMNTMSAAGPGGTEGDTVRHEQTSREIVNQMAYEWLKSAVAERVTMGEQGADRQGVVGWLCELESAAAQQFPHLRQASFLAFLSQYKDITSQVESAFAAPLPSQAGDEVRLQASDSTAAGPSLHEELLFRQLNAHVHVSKFEDEETQRQLKAEVFDLLLAYLSEVSSPLSWGVLQRAISHIHKQLTEQSKHDVFASAYPLGFVSFIAEHEKPLRDKGFDLTLGPLDEPSSLPSMPLVTHFLHQHGAATSTHGLDASGEAVTSALCAEFRIEEEAWLRCGPVSSLMHIAEASQDMNDTAQVGEASGLVFGSLLAPPPSTLDKESACLSEVEVIDLIASGRVPELESIGSALLWPLRLQRTHGPLETFILKHRSALAERCVSALHCVDPLTGTRHFVKVAIRDKADIYRALEDRNAVHKPTWLASHFTSFLCANGGVRNLTSSELLANSFKTFWANLKAASQQQQQQQQDGTVSTSIPLFQRTLFDLLLALPPPIAMSSDIIHPSLLAPLKALMPDWERQSDPFVRRLPHAAQQRLFAVSYAVDLPVWIEALREGATAADDTTHVAQELSYSNSSSHMSAVEAPTQRPESRTPAVNVRKEDGGSAEPPDEADVLEKLQAPIQPSAFNAQRQKCWAVIEDIRSNLDLESQLRDVHMSAELRKHVEHSIDEAQKRQGRMLQKISTDLYDKDFHFVFELIQNADDNHYDDGVIPSLQLTLSQDGIRLFNNEKGFEEKNIRAICDVGSSTKSRKRGESGLIGRKGIGFKSVFSVSNTPHICSNGFSLFFDASDKRLGYILPHHGQDPVVEPSDGELLFDITVDRETRLKASTNSWTTLIDLPFKEHNRYQQSFLEKCARELGNIHPPLLLFLNRLRQLSIVNRVTAIRRRLARQDRAQLPTSSLCLSVETDAEIIRLVEDDEHQDWLVVRQQRMPTLTAWRLKSEDQSENDDGVEPTVIQVAVPLKADGEMDHQPVCAYLPLTARPMKMTLQADWTVTSSRETVKEDNVWNLWLRDEFASLMVDTVIVLKSTMASDNPDTHLPPDFLFRLLPLFPDLSVDRSSWYRPVVEGLQSRLKKGIAWVLTADGEWHEPSSCLLVPSGSLDDLMSIIPPADLYESMGLKYVHRAIAQLLERQGNIETRGRQLGMEVGSASFFFNYLVRLHEAGKLVEKPIDWLGKVFLILHVSIAGTRHNTKEKATHMKQMKGLPLVPIRGGHRMAANACQLFLPRWEGEHDAERFSLWRNCGVHWCAETHQSQYAFEIQLPTVDPALWAGREDDEKARIVELLGRFGVKHATDELLIAFLAQHLNDEPDAQVWASVACYLHDLGGHESLASLPNRDAVEKLLVSLRLICTYRTLNPHDELPAGLKPIPTDEPNSDVQLVLASPLTSPMLFSKTLDPTVDVFGLEPPDAPIDWLLIHPVYLDAGGHPHRDDTREKWARFLQEIGVRRFCWVMPRRVSLFPSVGEEGGPFECITRAVWRQQLCPQGVDSGAATSTIKDFQCVPLERLLMALLPSPAIEEAVRRSDEVDAVGLTGGQVSREVEERLMRLLSVLHSCKDEIDSVSTVKSAAGAELHSSFFVLLRVLPWLPSDRGTLHRPSDLWLPERPVVQIFQKFAPYLARSGRPFAEMEPTLTALGVQSSLDHPGPVLSLLKLWGARPLDGQDDAGAPIRTTLGVMSGVYCLLDRMEDAREIRDFFDKHCGIWVPIERPWAKKKLDKEFDGEWKSSVETFLMSGIPGYNERRHGRFSYEQAMTRFRFLDHYYEIDLAPFFEKAGCHRTPEDYAKPELLGGRLIHSPESRFREGRDVVIGEIKRLLAELSTQAREGHLNLDGRPQLSRGLREASIWRAFDHNVGNVAKGFVDLTRYRVIFDDLLDASAPLDPAFHRQALQPPSDADQPIVLFGGGSAARDRLTSDENMLPLLEALDVPRLSTVAQRKIDPSDLATRPFMLLRHVGPSSPLLQPTDERFCALQVGDVAELLAADVLALLIHAVEGALRQRVDQSDSFLHGIGRREEADAFFERTRMCLWGLLSADNCPSEVVFCRRVKESVFLPVNGASLPVTTMETSVACDGAKVYLTTPSDWDSSRHLHKLSNDGLQKYLKAVAGQLTAKVVDVLARGSVLPRGSPPELWGDVAKHMTRCLQAISDFVCTAFDSARMKEKLQLVESGKGGDVTFVSGALCAKQFRDKLRGAIQHTSSPVQAPSHWLAPPSDEPEVLLPASVCLPTPLQRYADLLASLAKQKHPQDESSDNAAEAESVSAASTLNPTAAPFDPLSQQPLNVSVGTLLEGQLPEDPPAQPDQNDDRPKRLPKSFKRQYGSGAVADVEGDQQPRQHQSPPAPLVVPEYGEAVSFELSASHLTNLMDRAKRGRARGRGRGGGSISRHQHEQHDQQDNLFRDQSIRRKMRRSKICHGRGGVYHGIADERDLTREQMQLGGLQKLVQDIYQANHSSKGETAVELAVDGEDPRGEIGRAGERIVFEYLRDVEKEAGRDESCVIWVNEEEESGLPFDIVVARGCPAIMHIRQLLDDEQLLRLCEVVEVKSTSRGTKEHIDLSMNELRFALQKRSKYILYRVFGMSVGQDAPTVRLEKYADLCMHIRKLHGFLVSNGEKEEGEIDVDLSPSLAQGA